MKHNSRINTIKSNFCKVLESNRDGILITNKKGIVLFVNSAAEKLFGRNKKTLEGHNFGNPIVSGETTEINTIQKEGGVRTSEVTALEILWEEKPAILLVFHDITVRKKAEEDLKSKNEQLEKFNKMAVGRELKMIKLKNRIKKLEAKLSKTKK